MCQYTIKLTHTFKQRILKNCSIAFVFILIGFLFTQCKSETVDDSDFIDLSDNYDAFQKFDLSPFDINANMMLPDETANIGASTKPTVLHEEDGFKWDVEIGPNFQVHIEDWGANRGLVADKKSKNQDLEIYEIKYLIDDPDFIVYETKLKVDGVKNAPQSVGVPHITYHVFAEKVIDGITYEFRSRDDGYERVIIELMAKTIRSAKANK